jgi:Zn-dependent M28 family amino/carboxypeptidase
MTFKFGLLAVSFLALSACKQAHDNASVSDTTLRVFETLSADAMAGRKAGTEGNRKAREFLVAEAEGLKAFDTLEVVRFDFERPIRNEAGKVTGQEPLVGYNIEGLIDTDDGDVGPLLVVTAHFDHLGERDGEIYNGADDNASGSAALFAIAEHFKAAPSAHDVLIVWLDAEEMGLSGAKALLDGKSNFEGRSVFNLNLDMISQNEDELYFAGAYHTPALEPLMTKAGEGTGLTLLFGHDAPEDGANDWTLQSDHGVFHRRGIPFGYFGVEDHPHYHQTTDEFDTIPLDFYASAVRTVVNAARLLDENLDEFARSARE